MNWKIFISLLLIFPVASAMDHDTALGVVPKTHQLKSDYETIRSLVKGSLGAMAIWRGVDLLNVTSHELGHAAVGKILFHEPKMHITIGSSSSESHVMLYSGKNFSLTSNIFTIRPSYWFMNGGCVSWISFSTTPINFAAMCAAGPLVGIGLNIALFCAANKLEDKGYDKTAAFLKMTAAAQTYRQLRNFYIYNINSPDVDGEHIANKLNFSENTQKVWNRSIRYVNSGIFAVTYIGAIWFTDKLVASVLLDKELKDMPSIEEILTQAKIDLKKIFDNHISYKK